MSELLIRVVDRGGVDAPKGYGDSKAGDVISICPDGWGWSKEERTNPMWRIVRMSLTPVECNALLAKGDGDSRFEPCHKRKYKFDFSKLAIQFPNAFDGKRNSEIIDASSQLAMIRTAISLKPSIIV